MGTKKLQKTRSSIGITRLVNRASSLKGFEELEDRRMLAVEADILFLIDKSGSSRQEFDWVGDIVSQANGLDDYLSDPQRDIDARYGLIGFADDINRFGGPSLAHGHSHAIDFNDLDGDGDLLFGTASQLDAIADNSVILNPGTEERVWDSIEHAIAEYDFRDGAAVIIIGFRRDDTGGGGTFAGNQTGNRSWHQFEGIQAALDSHNASFNAVVEAVFDPSMGSYVYGVEPDELDGSSDGRHIAYVQDPVSNQPTFSDFLQVSYNGTLSGTALATGQSILVSSDAAGTLAGPNGFGYLADSSSTPFDDISQTGTKISEFVSGSFVEDKQLTATELAGFNFDFFGSNYADLYVNADGSITFGGASLSVFENQEITNWEADAGVFPPEIPRIAPLWDSYNISEPYDTYWEVKDSGLPSERLIVQWDSYNFSGDSGSGANETVTFQAVLYANGDILFSYEDLSVTDSLHTDGARATVGIATDAAISPEVIPPNVFVDGLHDIEGNFTGVEADFVRLAWATGGTAWNNEAVAGPLRNDPVIAPTFDAEFIASIGNQILRKHETGDVAFADNPLFEVNIGGPTSGSFVSDDDFEMQNGIDIFPNPTVLTNSTSPVVANGNSMSDDANTLAVFDTGRRSTSASLDLAIEFPASVVPDGDYVVELMFASHSDTASSGDSRQADVYVEGSLMLDNYIIARDRGRVDTSTPVGPEFELNVSELGRDVPIVKRYATTVDDGNGLSILIDSFSSTFPDLNGLLNGIRVLQVPPPVLVFADFDDDGDVDGFDFLLWQRGFGMSTGATRLDGDADGDGDVDVDDLMVWSDEYGHGVAADADFNDDMVVDGLDLQIWENSFGVDELGDADGDGDTDGFDFLAWQIQFLQQTDSLDEITDLVDSLQYLEDTNQLVVSITNDEVDGDNSLGDVSLREAVILANAATVPTTIILPTGRYSLTRTGTETGDASYNDLDITGDVTIVGDGAGFSIIDSTALTGSDGRALYLNTSTAKLRLDSLTIANGASASNGQGVYVQSGDSLEIYDSAIVNHEGWAGGSGVAVTDADVTIRRSVFTHNDNTSPNPGATGAALAVSATTSGSASLTLGQSIFAYNVQANGTQHAVWTNANVTKTNEGDNLYDTAAGGFFNTTSGTGDHLGTPDYVVTSVADTFDHTDDDEALSIREAVNLANITAGTEEIWLPAWHFELTRDRATYGGGSSTDTDVAFGDIDISDSVTLRGVSSALTNVAWKPGTTEDEVFKLLGDYDGDGGVDEDLVSQLDYQYWNDDNGSTGGYEDYHTDGNEDGVVDNDDYTLWQSMLYNNLTKHNLSVG